MKKEVRSARLSCEAIKNNQAIANLHKAIHYRPQNMPKKYTTANSGL